MKRLRFSGAARADILAIGRYTKEQFGIKQRDTYLKKLFAAFETIQKSPLIGKSRDDVYLSVRSLHVEKHVVFYVATLDEIQISRILHQSMEPARHIGSSRV